MKETAHLTHTYTADSMCQGWANAGGFWHPGTTYDFKLTNLKPNTMYYYSYGTPDVSDLQLLISIRSFSYQFLDPLLCQMGPKFAPLSELVSVKGQRSQ